MNVRNASDGLAIMQPYFFPYLGYYSLAMVAKEFVFFDDVQYIKKGWINKNVLGNGASIIVPLQKASINKKICDIKLLDDIRWKQKLLNSVWHCYRGAPYFDRAYSLVSEVLEQPHETAADIAIDSIVRTCQHLNINLDWKKSSESFSATCTLRKEHRIQAILEAKGMSRYYNLMGGQAIYSKDDFKVRGYDLHFVNNLSALKVSIIDYLMKLPSDDILCVINDFELV